MMAAQAEGGVAVFVAETEAIGAQARAQARRLALRSAAAVLGADEREIGLQHEPGGRPYLVGAGLGLHLSISHGRGLAGVALTRPAPVGLDHHCFAMPTSPWQPENVVLALALPGGESDVMGAPVALWTLENTHGSV